MKHMRLNQFIAQAGVCSRRKADSLIQAGAVEVNGAPVSTLGYQVAPGDRVTCHGKLLSAEKKVYYILNKPTNTLTTLHDPAGRRTVLDLIGRQAHPRVYPVGRLDRNTTGLLLLTNDGALARQLAHPSSQVPKVYHVHLGRGLQPTEQHALGQGVLLSDGLARADKVTLLDRAGRHLRLTLHSGRNRVIRRLFEALDIPLKALDRAEYAGLTYAGLPQGSWRPLTPAELALLRQWDGSADRYR